MSDYMITISKAKRQLKITDEMVESGFNEDVYKAIFAEGLKSFLNKGMSGVKVKDLDDDELEEQRDKAFEIAEANLKMLLEGKIKKSRAKGPAKESRAVIAEGRRLAKEALKAAYRHAGKKTTGIKASALTAAADELIEADPVYLEKARINVAKMEEREKVTLEPTGKLAEIIASAEDAKPRVAPTRGRKRETASEGDVVAARSTQKGGTVRPSVRH